MRLSSRVKQWTAGLVGLSPNDVYILQSVQHRGWAMRSVRGKAGPVPVQRFAFAPVPSRLPGDLELCERLISAYERSARVRDDRGSTSPMWDSYLAQKYGALRAMLEAGDAARLADAMSVMFRREFMFGIDSGDLYTGRNWRVHSLKLLDDLVSLAEQLGVVRTESGQGTIGHAFEHGLESLVDRIEAAIGASIAFPEVGGPYGIYAGRRLLMMQSPEYVYVAWRIRDAIERHLPSGRPIDLLEIGAGYGGTACFLSRFLDARVRSYTIIDLPIVNVLQGYFLSRAYGPERVRLHGEAVDPVSAVVRVLPTSALDDQPDVDIVLNENSLPEIPEQAATAYVRWASEHAREFFYSYNHETLTADRSNAVITVPEITSRMSTLRRVSRNVSWLRPGYVEEIYVRSGR